jgi:hypothetical protein
VRTVHWLFVVSAALFVSGIALVVASERTVRRAPAAAAAPVTSVATIRQVMRGIITPAAFTIFRSVGSIITADGIEETAPQSEADWDLVGSSAAAIIEAGNLLLASNRAVDKGEWVKMTRAMIDAAKVALQGAQEKDKDKIFEVGEALNASCDSCHQRYQRAP